LPHEHGLGRDHWQAVDFLCYSARDYEDRCAAADTIKINGNIFIRKGSVIYSVNCNPMFTVVDDTCGFHDRRLLLPGAQPPALWHGPRDILQAGRLLRPAGGDGLQPYSGPGHRLPARGIIRP